MKHGFPKINLRAANIDHSIIVLVYSNKHMDYTVNLISSRNSIKEGFYEKSHQVVYTSGFEFRLANTSRFQISI